MVTLSLVLLFLGCGSRVSWELLKADCVPSAEIWYDGVDQDCAGDDDFDQDGDGVPVEEDCWDDPNDVSPLSEAVGEGLSLDAAEVFPDADDAWYDGVDQDCDGADDFDQDGDGFQSANDEQADGSVGDDCVDGSANDEVFEDSCSGELITVDPADAASVNPDATDTYYDGLDQNCDGADDNDADGDGYAVCDECDDTDSSLFPNEDLEIWYDCRDQNCDGNDGDRDEDGYVDADYSATCAEWADINPRKGAGDCDDDDDTIHPAADEGVSDGIDQNCDGFESCYDDDDNDGYRDDVGSVIASSDLDCADSGEATATDPAGDCDDKDSTINPGASEIAGDEADQNCDDLELCFLDNDDDGYRPDRTTTRSSADLDCTDVGEARASEPTTDCNDSSSTINPGATELAGDEVDQNCDSQETCYKDADNDGFRPDSTSTVSSSDTDCADSGEAKSSEPTNDCNDISAAINPGATEVCDVSNTDEDCDGLADDNDSSVSSTTKLRYYKDADSDTYGDEADSGALSCDGTSTYQVEDNTDCDDTAATTNPGVTTDTCWEGVDNDCDVAIDEGANGASCYSASGGELVVSELFILGNATTDPQGEWFEVYNPHATRTVYMESMTITRQSTTTGNVSFTVNEVIAVAPQDTVVFCYVGTYLGSLCDFEYGVITGTNFALTQNSNTTLVVATMVADVTSRTLDSVNYNGMVGSASGWPGVTAGYSYELRTTKLTATDNDNGAHWCETTGSAYYTASSRSDYGTPNATNTCP